MDALLNGGLIWLSTIAQLLLVSLGLAVIYGLMRVINFAHAEFLAIGGFVVLVMLRNDVNFWLAVLLAPLVAAAVGVVVERLVIRFLYDRIIDSLLATFAVSLILTQLLVNWFGSTPSGMRSQLGSFQIGQYSVGQYRVLLILLAPAVFGGTWYVFTRTLYGVRARAAMVARDTASSFGINWNRLNMLSFAFGAGLAGLGGALLSPLITVEPFMGQKFLARAFLIVISGGSAAVTGSAVSGTLLGTAQHAGTVIATPSIGQVLALVTAVLVVRILPRGLSALWRSEI